jgi:hypothetical protein
VHLVSGLEIMPLYITQDNNGIFKFNEDLLSKDTDKRSEMSGLSKACTHTLSLSLFLAGLIVNIKIALFFLLFFFFFLFSGIDHEEVCPDIKFREGEGSRSDEEKQITRGKGVCVILLRSILLLILPHFQLRVILFI